MIALASARTPPELSVRYLVGDVMAESLPPRGFDVVVSVNVVHHFAVRAIVARLAELVAPLGVLLLQDVVTRPGLRYLLPNIVGAVQQRARRLLNRRGSHEVGRLYDRHGAGEVYLTPAEVRRTYPELLPGVKLEQHADWRYSAIWTRPQQADELGRQAEAPSS